MAHAERSVTDAAADPDQFHIRVGICHVDLALLITSRGEKTRGRDRICFFPAFCKTCGNTDQILFCDPGLHELLRVVLSKRCERSASSGIAAQRHDIFICFCRFHQHFADHLLIRCISHS